jgi:hypothetical protein
MDEAIPGRRFATERFVGQSAEVVNKRIEASQVLSRALRPANQSQLNPQVGLPLHCSRDCRGEKFEPFKIGSMVKGSDEADPTGPGRPLQGIANHGAWKARHPPSTQPAFDFGLKRGETKHMIDVFAKARLKAQGAPKQPLPRRRAVDRRTEPVGETQLVKQVDAFKSVRQEDDCALRRQSLPKFASQRRQIPLI